MSKRSRFAVMSAIVATLGVGGLALLFGLPWLQIAAFMVITALLGALWVVLLAHARVRPSTGSSSSADDTLITAVIADDIASGIHSHGGDDAGLGHGP